MNRTEKLKQVLQEFCEEHVGELAQKLFDADFTYAPQIIYTRDQMVELLQRYREQDIVAFANYIKHTLINYVIVMDERPEGSDRIIYYKDAIRAVDIALEEAKNVKNCNH